MATKRVSIKALDRIAAETGKDKVIVDWHGESLEIDTMLTLGEAILFVDNIVNACVDTVTGEYHPEIEDFAVRSAVAAMYTNIAVPENAEHQYKLLYKTDLFDTVMENINQRQYSEMMLAVSRKLRFKLDVDKQHLKKMVEDAAYKIDKLATDVAAIFANVTPEDVQKITQAIGNGFSEDKLVQAIVDNMHGGEKEQPAEEVAENG